MKTPIIDYLKEYISKDLISFHTPGHKNRIDQEFSSLMHKIDITEIHGSDSLLNAQGIIRESQEQVSRLYKSAYTFFSVQGSTSANYIALAALTRPKDKVLIQRDSHISVNNGLILNDLQPIYLPLNYDQDFEISAGLVEGSIEEAFDKNPDIKLVVLTSPNYYGLSLDIKNISSYIHKKGAKLIVDGAHASHFNFLEKGPRSALEQGADIVINSAHKTLPALTQTSLIHLASIEDYKDMRQAFNLYMTTSPSYILMASLEYSLSYMDKYGRKNLLELTKEIDRLKEALNKYQNINIYSPDKDYLDPMRLVFNIDGFSGEELMSILREEYNINMEMHDHKNVLALFSAKTRIEDLNALYKATIEISKDLRKANKIHIHSYYKENMQKLLPREAYFREKEDIDLYDSLGRIAGSAIIPYPPGIGLILPGEEISQELIDYIVYLMENKVEIIGLDKGRVRVIK